jgi:hypothetical protein
MQIFNNTRSHNGQELRQYEVTYKYYLPDNEIELKLHRLAADFFSAISEINDECTTILGKGPRAGEGVEEFAEKIHAICCESGFEMIP